jgi:kexin
MPTEEEDDNHDEISTTTVPASTTTLPPDPATTETDVIVSTASDHPDRPVNSKPTDTTSSTTSTSATSTPPASSPPAAEETSASTWLPSFLPTFGMSASTQAWIYGALGLIVVFCSGLGVYLYMARRKRLRNGAARDDYEFELLDEEEAQGLNSGEKNGGAGGKKGGRRTRGGELYDAFAGGSDDDDDDFGDGYRDRAEEAMSGGLGRPEMSEKTRMHGRGVGRDEEDEEELHVVGDDDDDEDEERPLRSSGR